MVDLLNKRSVEIRTEGSDGSEGRGSGFPVGNGLIMTCEHVVADKDVVWVRWCEFPDDAPLPPDLEYKEYTVNAEGGRRNHRFVKAGIKYLDSKIDIALLEVFHPEGFGYFPVSRFDGAVNDRVGGIGFPRATQGGVFRSVPLNGRVDQAPSRDKGMLLQIRLDDGVDTAEDWRGASGAPVVCMRTNAIIGIYRITEEYRKDANTVWARSARDVWRHPEISKIISGAVCDDEARARAYDEHKQRFSQLIELELERLNERMLLLLLRRLKIVDGDGDRIQRCVSFLMEQLDSSLHVLSILWRDFPQGNRFWPKLLRYL